MCVLLPPRTQLLIQLRPTQSPAHRPRLGLSVGGPLAPLLGSTLSAKGLMAPESLLPSTLLRAGNVLREVQTPAPGRSAGGA